ncbi:CRISPR-associated protein Cas5, Dvulg subtype [Candidatus Methylobacter favarea]|uniref:pre-crRNA processing endonuclease n=1 Tax=Candidatus Methylobacter favarea TaxID=2707345 RepID=A0A8S0X8D6_9GAMM|nr:type I-C CRISPR-associated protein Cas5c [Candidatus Methylobacter favarea]CAA9891020.1 CRISPR-associated protein Cas5, Dvulg subtype [Candidatus Methylobacter favarea]
MKNSISFRLWGRYALFTDPITKVGGEKCSYHLPTYEAIKGVLKSIYWKPTLIWYVDKVRVIKPLRTQTKGTKPLVWNGGNSLAIYTFLRDVEYQVEAHFEWNEYRPELAKDRIDGKHFSILKRTLEKGGRQDIFLGTRDCQAYVEPCEFGAGEGAYDELDELAFGLMFHSFAYPDETGKDQLESILWNATLKRGILEFPKPENCEKRRKVRDMYKKTFVLKENIQPVDDMEEWL